MTDTHPTPDRRFTTKTLKSSLRRLRSTWRLNQHRTQPKSSPPTFFSLPYEIREQIYLNIVARHPLIHIIRKKDPPRRLRAVCCLDDNPQGKPLSLHNCWNEHLWYVKHKTFPQAFGDPKKDGRVTGQSNLGVMEFLVSCRQIYQEAAPLLYGTNTFDLLHIDALIMLAQPAYLPPSFFRQIRHLRLSYTPSADFYHSRESWASAPISLNSIYRPQESSSDPSSKDVQRTAITECLPSLEQCMGPGTRFLYGDWVRIWSVVAQMEGLATLHLRLNATDYPGEFDTRCSILRPLLKMHWRDAGDGLGLSRLESFKVAVKWDPGCLGEVERILLEAGRKATQGTMSQLPFSLVKEEMVGPYAQKDGVLASACLVQVVQN